MSGGGVYGFVMCCLLVLLDVVRYCGYGVVDLIVGYVVGYVLYWVGYVVVLYVVWGGFDVFDWVGDMDVIVGVCFNWLEIVVNFDGDLFCVGGYVFVIDYDVIIWDDDVVVIGGDDCCVVDVDVSCYLFILDVFF